MRRTSLKPEFDWERWQSTEEDLPGADASLVKRLLFQIFLINSFEQAVLILKADDCVWGPVHASVGQEAVAAAAIAALRKTDKIAGTHRAHHQFLAKVLNFVSPDGWDPSQDELPAEAARAVRRTLAEIMGLAEGYCGGRGGSMHLRCAEAGVLGTNAIVGGGIPIATGAAFAEKYVNTDNVVVCFFGDGAINQGSFHESANLAGLWRLPIIYFLENNLYAVATPVRQACAVSDLSLRALSYRMSGIIVDGADPLAIHAAVSEAAARIRDGSGPFLIEATCYRRYHHAGDKPGSVFGYRSKDEEAQWMARDPIFTLPKAAAEAGILDEACLTSLKEKAQVAVAQAVDYCTNPGKPRVVRTELWPKADSVVVGLRSDGREWEGVSFSEREDFSEYKQVRYSAAIAAVTERWLERDPTVVVLGEEVANFLGGAYGATRGLPAKYPERVLNTPISEAGFTGLASGAAISGLRMVVEIMFPDFSLVAADQLFNQIPKIRYVYGGGVDLTLVVRTRIAVGCGYGAQHSMDPVGLYALFPGWRIVVPSDAFDYVGLFNSAMRSLDPVLIAEHHSLYPEKFPVPRGNLDYFIRFGRARVVDQGSDLTVLTYGAMVHRCRQVREELAGHGISTELIDLRSLDLPSIDYLAVESSLAKTHRVMIVEEAPASHSIGAHLAAEIVTRFHDRLEGPPVRVASLDVPNPVSRVLEVEAILSNDRILAAALGAVKGERPAVAYPRSSVV